ncbi:hypothetical protein GE118_02895 [Mycoplasma sp. NEAQ87857]|uniref:PD-(D/E)XK nuclease family protein n=1 Tax=Mycoplasma sp. NEAQ87857 TaxID=2683967 RepID=UPI0013193829|nr:PD-(D/E)XK nuclease family protein [Mycoplasma sp. NEAQ87857]QGZ97737.1 hypothetical protein GE118_02895 [Mycoplasma sp. NEAQ87857]
MVNNFDIAKLIQKQNIYIYGVNEIGNLSIVLEIIKQNPNKRILVLYKKADLKKEQYQIIREMDKSNVACNQFYNFLKWTFGLESNEVNLIKAYQQKIIPKKVIDYDFIIYFDRSVDKKTDHFILFFDYICSLNHKKGHYLIMNDNVKSIQNISKKDICYLSINNDQKMIHPKEINWILNQRNNNIFFYLVNNNVLKPKNKLNKIELSFAQKIKSFIKRLLLKEIPITIKTNKSKDPKEAILKIIIKWMQNNQNVKILTSKKDYLIKQLANKLSMPLRVFENKYIYKAGDKDINALIIFPFDNYFFNSNSIADLMQLFYVSKQVVMLSLFEQKSIYFNQMNLFDYIDDQNIFIDQSLGFNSLQTRQIISLWQSKKHNITSLLDVISDKDYYDQEVKFLKIFDDIKITKIKLETNIIFPNKCNHQLLGSYVTYSYWYKHISNYDSSFVNNVINGLNKYQYINHNLISKHIQFINYTKQDSTEFLIYLINLFNWVNDPYRTNDKLSQIKFSKDLTIKSKIDDQLAKSIDNFMIKLLGTNETNVEIEKKIKLKHVHQIYGDIYINGRIDAIDHHNKIIYEFKTTSEKSLVKEMVQLILYKYILETKYSSYHDYNEYNLILINIKTQHKYQINCSKTTREKILNKLIHQTVLNKIEIK